MFSHKVRLNTNIKPELLYIITLLLNQDSCLCNEPSIIIFTESILLLMVLSIPNEKIQPLRKMGILLWVFVYDFCSYHI